MHILSILTCRLYSEADHEGFHKINMQPYISAWLVAYITKLATMVSLMIGQWQVVYMAYRHLFSS